MNRGFFAIGIWHTKTEENVGTLFRSASLYGASFIYTIGRRYQRQASDTAKTPLHTPLFHFNDLDDLIGHLPWSTPLIGIEMGGKPLAAHSNNWERCCYLLGAEDHGLPQTVLDRCYSVLSIESPVERSMNVSVAGSIVLHDRYVKQELRKPMAVAS